MPILHTQVNAQVAQPGDSKLSLPPRAALASLGPVLQVTINLEQSFAMQLMQQGITLPAPISGWGLVDTGASITCIDDAAAQQMHLPVIDVVTMTSASHSSIPQNVYPI